MLDVMISIHVPKTGGTTFLRLLERLFGEQLLLDYRWTDVRLALGSAREIERSLENVRCIHGHFTFPKYAALKGRDGVVARFVTWLRDPVDRVVSAYEYLRARPVQPGMAVMPWEKAAKELELVQFVEKGFGCNNQFKQLATDSPQDFDFVGITEEYSRSLRLFRSMFFPGQELSLDVDPQRVNPARQDERYALEDEARSLIERRNDRDAILYRRGRERFARLCEEHSVGP